MYQRIISLAPSNTEILYALNSHDKLVAVTRYCDFPDDARKKPKIGGWLDINDKLVKSHNPDLILTSTFVQNNINKEYKKIVDLMENKFNEIQNKITAGKKFRDMRVSGSKRTRSQVTAKFFSKPRVYVEEWHKPPTVSCNWVPTLVKMAGGDYGLIKAGTHSKEVTTEQIQKYDPEIIIISICGMADKVPKEWITKRSGWENLSAVKNNKVYVFDDSWLNRPGPRLTIGLENLAKVIHPECF